MTDDEIDPGDELDPTLEAEFAALARTAAPDVWSRIETPAAGRRGPARRILFGSIAAMVLVIGGLVAVFAVQSRGSTDTVSDVATGGGDESADSAAGAPVCSTNGLVEDLRQGLPPFDYEPSASIADLAEGSDLIVRGELTRALNRLDGTVLDTKILGALSGGESATGAPVSVFTPATSTPEGLLQGRFIAFLGDAIEDPLRPGHSTRRVAVEGLWVACAPDERAVPVIVAPDAPGWEPVLSLEPTLEELWEMLQYPDGAVTTTMPAALVRDEVAIHDLRLVGGDRFRLALPATLGEGFTLTERPPPAPLVLESDRTSITISFQYCPDQRGLVENALGSEIAMDADGIRLCRPDQLIAAHIQSDVDLGPDDIDRFDVRPIQLGATYGPILSAAWPDHARCAPCSPWGPLVFEEAGIVVTRLGRNGMAAVHLDTLEDRWSFETAGDTLVLLAADADSFLVDIEDAALAAGLQAWTAEGTARWGLPHRHEANAAVSGHADDVWLLRTSAADDEDRAATVRRFDRETGEVLWMAEGRVGASWPSTRPVVIGGVAVVLDVIDRAEALPDDAGTVLWGFDVATGERRWSTIVDPDGESQVDGSELVVLEFEGGPALIVRGHSGEFIRVEPATGAELWRTTVTDNELSGTSFGPDGTMVIDLSTRRGSVELDPTTGEIVAEGPAPDPFVCPTTDGNADPFVPPPPWPRTPLASDMAWYGSADLWTAIDLGEPAQRKGVFWSANFPGGAIEGRPPLEIVYERLDASRPPIIAVAPGTNAYTVEEGDFMINGFSPDEPGCWQVTATYKDATLTYVYDSR